MRFSRFSDRLKEFFRKSIAILRQQTGTLDMGVYEALLFPQREDGQEASATVVTIGKTNFVVSERFAEGGKDISELMERLVIEKCRKIS